ncbi:hypothetical protein RB601_007209 [Gaeumannomyces tritici]
MASPKVSEALAQIAASGSKGADYEALLADFPSYSSAPTAAADLKATIDAVFAAPLNIVGTLPVLNAFVAALPRAAPGDHDAWVDVAAHALDRIAANPQTASSFLEQANALRELTATAHEHNEDWVGAARALADIPLDSSQRRVGEAEMVRVWIRIVRNYLEADDSTSAGSYLNKIKNVIFKVDDPDLNLHFRLSQARINDSRREFLAACHAYHEISMSHQIGEDERLHTLGMAVKCAILAPAGPLRSRALGRLHRDERSPGLDEFGMLEKMFLDRLLEPAEVDKFARGLQPHQLATTADGSTVLVKAVIEHNLLGASRLYDNIGFDELGDLLGLDAAKAEETTARMIEQGRLVGRIDQIDRFIWFEGGEASGVKGSGRAEAAVAKEMRRWDSNVQSLAEEVEHVTGLLQKEFPVGLCCGKPSRLRPETNMLGTRRQRWRMVHLGFCKKKKKKRGRSILRRVV